MNHLIRKHQSGFTLIELITVIVILGVLTASVTGFLTFGTKIYTQATARDQLASSARFAIERLNRDVRNALPNSLRLTNGTNGGQCIEFTPIIESTIYTHIPVVPNIASNEIEVIKFGQPFDENWQVAVYTLSPEDVYNNTGKVYPVDSIDSTGDEWLITLESNVNFLAHSPTQRLYFINGSVEYCLQNNQLFRDGILMAQNIYNDTLLPFEVQAATLQRNSMLQIQLQFKQHSEVISFNNEVQVLNVP